MMKSILYLSCCLLLLVSVINSQEVIIKDFPKGVAGSVDSEFFKPYYPQLQAIADSLRKHTGVNAIITGGADGETYKIDNDAKNPGLALGRAHVLRDLLIKEFNVLPSQLYVNSENVNQKGSQYRYASIRLVWDQTILSSRLDNLASQLDTLSKRPPVEKHFTEIKEVPQKPLDNYGINLSLGVMTSPFGGIPTVSSAVTWKKIIYVEVNGGHSFWNSSYEFDNEDLDTRKRMVGGQLIVYPFEKHDNIGIMAGWIRIEEISQEYYDYARLSEGPIIGIRANVAENISISACFNPAKHRIAGSNVSESKNDQFLFSVNFFKLFGGSQ